MNLQEFEEQYAKNSHVTVDWLHSKGQYGAPCNCKEEDCQGWEMKNMMGLGTTYLNPNKNIGGYFKLKN